MSIGPEEWARFCLHDGPVAFVFGQLFGPSLKQFFGAWTNRALAGFDERTKTKGLLARAEGDAKIEARKLELRQSDAGHGGQDADTPGVATSIEAGEVRPGEDFEIVEDDTLLEASLTARARLGGDYRARVRQANLESVFIKMFALPPRKVTPAE